MVAEIPGLYSGWLHFLWINASCAAAVVACVWFAREADPRVWLLAIPFFAFANLCEWLFHRGPLHAPTRFMKGLYRRHTGSHHVAFTDRDMAYVDSRELWLVLFPVYMFPVLLLLTAPLSLGLAWAWPPLGWVFLGTAFAYYWVYEWLHLLHHWPQESWLGRRRLVGWLRRHHARHHDPKRMRAGNFNVSFPLCDYLLGTVLRAEEPPAPELPEAAEA